MVQPPGFSPGAFLCPLNAPPIVAGFFMPCPCDGSSSFLSGLFFGGFICHLPILSSCVGFLVPSWHRRHIIPLLQGRYRACTGRFPGVASCTTTAAFARSAPSGQPQGGTVRPWRSFRSPKNPPIFHRKFERFFRWIFLGFFPGHSR